MANTTKDIARTYEAGVEPIFNDYGVEASTTIYEGAAVGIDPASNLAEAFATATSIFAGFALTKADNASGAAGDVNVHVRSRGVVKLTVATATDQGTTLDLGDAVYAVDDQTFNVTSTSQKQVGKVHRVVSQSASSAVVMVYFEADTLRSA